MQGSRVEIAIELENRSALPSEAATLVVEAAPLGAFISTEPLARVAIPRLDPGERKRLELSVARDTLPCPNALGRAILQRSRAPVGREEIELLSMVDWAGNLNVWFDVAPDRVVEVHRALNLKIGWGRAVGIGVFLPTQQADYEIAIHGSDWNWPARLFRLDGTVCVLIVRSKRPQARKDISIHVTRRADGLMVPVEFSFESSIGRSDLLGCVRV
jgi:hypothetical protein